MKRIIFFLPLILTSLFQGCSDINSTPSAIVLKHFDARQSGDIPTLRSTMTKEAYLTLMGQHIARLKGNGKVFDYDKTHYPTDPTSLRRLDAKLSDYFKSRLNPTLILISEKALDESRREIYMKLDGKDTKAVLIDIDSQWKISRLPGE